MKINLYNNYKEVEINFENIIEDIQETFDLFFDEDKEVSLILVDEDEIKRINKEYRNKDYVTDVISFEDDTDEEYLGDIFICVPKVYEQAKSYDHSSQREFAFLLTHGLLHLLGYDHLNEEEEKIMFNTQDEILNKTKYRRF